MTKKEYLDANVFYGLTNLNDGFDVESIQYFSESDFDVVLTRIEALNLQVFGIEPWYEEGFYGVEVYESYDKEANDPTWYRRAFNAFKKEKSGLMYAGSYGVPDELLRVTE